jgi:hypothetical protein
MFMYDPDLAKFGNAVSPIVPVESDRYAQLAMQRPFADRYNPRYDQPDATDWLMMALEEQGDTYVGASGDASRALWQKIDGVLKSTFGWNPSDISGASRWYPPLTEGGFLDAVDAFRSAGASCQGDAPKVSCSWAGAKFMLVHDVEGSLRVFIMDFGASMRTSGAFETLSDKTGIESGTAVAVLLIIGTSGLLAARNPKHVLEIGMAGAAGVALALAVNAKKRGGLR